MSQKDHSRVRYSATREALLVNIVIILMVSTVVLNYDSSSYARSEKLKFHDNKQIFGCGIYYDSIVRCDPLLNDIRSYSVNGTAKMVYSPPTKSAKAIFVDGIYGKALLLDGDGDYVRIPNHQALSPTQFTIAFWLQAVSELPDDARIVGNLKSSKGFAARYDDKTQGVVLWIYNTSGERTRTRDIQTDLPIGIYRHYAWTFDGTKITAYEDGIATGIIPFSGTYAANSDDSLYFAQHGEANVILDEVQIFDRPLTEKEIMEILHVPDQVLSGIVGYWKLDNDLGDVSENQNEGYIRTTRSRTYIPSMAFAPDGRLFFTEKTNGVMRIMVGDNVLTEPFVRISNVHDKGENGMLGITLDPDFTKNRLVYLYYTQDDSEGSEPFNRLVRYVDSNNTGTDMQILLDKIPASSRGLHSGGALAFGPDEKLYITVGNRARDELSQDPSSLNGKILRINKDGSIPDDNPFTDSPVYTLGHRNMFGIAFNMLEKFGIVTENGERHYDEINMIEKGENYGFPIQQVPDLPPELSDSSSKPLRSYWETIAPAQAIYYDGEKFPELKGKFIFAAFLTGNLHALEINKENKEIIEEVVIRLNHTGPSISLAPSIDGDIYYGGIQIYKLETVDLTNKEEILYNVKITGDINIANLEISKDDKKMTMGVEKQERSTFITIEIPKKLLDGIKFAIGVNEHGQEITLDIDVDNTSSDQNVLTLHIPSEISRVIIVGTTVIHEFSLLSILMISCISFMIVIYLQRRRMWLLRTF
jgi:glucose/arabinose dehydrogenase